MHKSKIVILIVIVGALLAALDASAQQLVRVGYSGTGVAKNLHKTIERAGLWKKRALDIRLIYFTSGATMAQAMVGNDLDIADSDVPAMLNAVSSGVLDGKLISVYVNRFPFAFVVRNEIVEYLTSRGLQATGEQEPKTRRALEFFAAHHNTPEPAGVSSS